MDEIWCGRYILPSREAAAEEDKLFKVLGVLGEALSFGTFDQTVGCSVVSACAE